MIDDVVLACLERHRLECISQPSVDVSIDKGKQMLRHLHLTSPFQHIAQVVDHFGFVHFFDGQFVNVLFQFQLVVDQETAVLVQYFGLNQLCPKGVEIQLG